MIETKEQYKQWKSLVIGPAGAEGPTGLDAAVIETIEVLREVARVAENALTYDNVQGIWTLSDDYAQDMNEAYARIPDWLTDG